MKRREIQLELLLGKRVYGLNGQPIGRIEEARAELDNRGACHVSEFLVGSYAMLERLAAWRIARVVLLKVRKKHGYRVRWDQLDLSDPRRPQLACEVDELLPLT